MESNLNKGFERRYSVKKLTNPEKKFECLVLEFDDVLARHAIEAYKEVVEAAGYIKFAEDIDCKLKKHQFMHDFQPLLTEDCQIDYRAGWDFIIRSFCRKLIGSDVKIMTIKEKFGGLRIYLDKNCGEDLFNLADLGYSESIKTCEICGNSGVRRQGGWIRTLCDKHAEGAKPWIPPMEKD